MSNGKGDGWKLPVQVRKVGTPMRQRRYAIWGEKVNNLQKWHLRRFCDKHGLDYQLIDNEISYYENKKSLQELVFDKQIDSKTIKSMLAEFEKCSIEEKYGIDPESSDIPLLILKAVIRVSYSHRGWLKRSLKSYPNRKKAIGQNYYEIRGIPSVLFELLNRLRERGIRYRLIRVSTPYLKTHQFIGGSVGWVKRPL